jgi:hypothetical protein
MFLYLRHSLAIYRKCWVLVFMNAFCRFTSLTIALTVGVQLSLLTAASALSLSGYLGSKSLPISAEGAGSGNTLNGSIWANYVPPDTGGPETTQGSGTR